MRSNVSREVIGPAKAAVASGALERLDTSVLPMVARQFVRARESLQENHRESRVSVVKQGGAKQEVNVRSPCRSLRTSTETASRLCAYASVSRGATVSCTFYSIQSAGTRAHGAFGAKATQASATERSIKNVRGRRGKDARQP